MVRPTRWFPEHLRRPQCPRPAPPLPPRQLPPRQPAFQQPCPRWAPGLLLLLPGPQGSAHALSGNSNSPSSAATAAVSSTACAAPRSTSCARCPASSRRRSTSLGRPMICGPAPGPDGQHVQARVISCVLGQACAAADRGIQTSSGATAYNAHPPETAQPATEFRVLPRQRQRGASTLSDAWRPQRGPADETGQAGCEAAGRLPGAPEAQDPRLASFENDFEALFRPPRFQGRLKQAPFGAKKLYSSWNCLILIERKNWEKKRFRGIAQAGGNSRTYGLARGTGWALENTLFRPQQGSKDAAVQDVRSANNMNDATQPQHFTLRSGSRASSQSGFRAQAQSNHTPRPFSWGLNPVALPQSQSSRASSSSGQSRRSLPPPSFDQLARDIEAA